MRLRLRPWPAFFWRIIKRRAPTSLFGRSLLIIVLPIAIMQLAVSYAFFDAHWRTVNSRLSEGLAGDVAWIVDAYVKDPSAAQDLTVKARRAMNLSVAFRPGVRLPASGRPILADASEASLSRALAQRLDRPFTFDAAVRPTRVELQVAVSGGVLEITAAKDRAFATRGRSFILWLCLATVVLTAIAVLFIRNQVRAIERLARAAEAFGKGEDLAFQPHGAREVRQAAAAFLAMKARIQRHVHQRTALLASVSHDLRTPLTRLKLELALSEPTDRTRAMQTDLVEMEHMIDEYLAFARGQAGEALEVVDLLGLLEAVRRGAHHGGAQIGLAVSSGLTAKVRPLAFKRALDNLVMNAVGHAKTVALAAAPTLAGGVEITVDDDGPGVPPERYEDAFAPFSRLDDARNQNTKGVGLGLAITRDVVRGHGGDVILGASAMGGLRASVRIPG